MPLVLSLCKHSVKKVADFSDDELVQVLGALIHFGQSDSYFTEALERHIPKKVFTMHPEAVSKVMQYCSQRRILSPPIFDTVAESFVYKADTFSTSQIARQIMPFGKLNYLPPNAGELFRKVEGVLRDRFSQFQPRTLLNLLHACTLIERFPVNFLAKVFSPYFLQQVEAQGTGLDRTVLAQLTQLFMTMKLECPFYEVDVEIKLDEEGYVLPATYHDEVYQRIAVCIDGQNRFCSNSQNLLGKEAIKQRHLKLLGYEIVQILFNPLDYDFGVDRIDYLEETDQTVVPEFVFLTLIMDKDRCQNSLLLQYLYYVDTSCKDTVLKSCSSLKNAGVVESGVYLIDPDGEEFGVDPFSVHCDMDSYPEVGITVVGHNSEDRLRISPCEDAGCYSRQIVYKQASLHQLRVLTETSETCEQFVKLECRHIRFLRENWGWWISRDGQKVQSWGGSSTNSGKCGCGERGDCDLGLSTCNCDANDEVWRSDEGYLTDKSVLPVREVRFGDTRDVPVEMAFYSIGKLQCKGEKTTIPVLESCAALKVAGFTKSGRYVIDPDGAGKGVSQFEVSCDMISDPVTGITLVSHDSETRMRVAPCESPGCYGRELNYEASLTQLNALTKVSRCCEQFVKLDCRHIRFLQSGWGWWVSWDGHKMLDWGGAEVNSSSCACGMTGPGRLCNCDSNDVIWRTDEGYLRHKSSLPVKAVHFGDTQDAPLEMAFHTVGKLTCKGRAMSDK
ncbi:FAKD3 protein, partial [Polypterus senegalus]